MRYARSAQSFARTASAVLNGFQRKRLNVDDLSDYMRRDLGLLDGPPRYGSGFAESDGRSRRLDLMTLTPSAS